MAKCRCVQMKFRSKFETLNLAGQKTSCPNVIQSSGRSFKCKCCTKKCAVRGSYIEAVAVQDVGCDYLSNGRTSAVPRVRSRGVSLWLFPMSGKSGHTSSSIAKVQSFSRKRRGRDGIFFIKSRHCADCTSASRWMDPTSLDPFDFINFRTKSAHVLIDLLERCFKIFILFGKYINLLFLKIKIFNFFYHENPYFIYFKKRKKLN